MILNGDCLDKLKTFPTNYFDAVVTDPPYGLGKEPDPAEVMKAWSNGEAYRPRGAGFMGKEWDAFVPGPEVWREIYRVLKPGGHVLSFFGTRTYDWGTMAMRFAGFEIRDQLVWLQGQGFPKNLDVRKAAIKVEIACGCEAIPKHEMRSLRDADLSKAVDAKNECGQVLQSSLSEQSASELRSERCPVVRRDEPLLARRELYRAGKGLSNGSCSESSEGEKERVCSGAHIDSRGNARQTSQGRRSNSSHKSQSLGQSSGESESVRQPSRALDGTSFPRCSKCSRPIFPQGIGTALKPCLEPIVLARKPLEKGLTVAENVLKWGTGGMNIDGCRIPVDEHDPNKRRSTGGYNSGKSTATVPNAPYNKQRDATLTQGRWPSNVLLDEEAANHMDQSFGTKQNPNPSRFFFIPKASKSERNAGLEGMPSKVISVWGGDEDDLSEGKKSTIPRQNFHPTVKPLKLMEYLITLITPPGGIVLDPFAGSGTTLVAAKKLGFGFIGIEREKEYCEIAEKRLEAVK